MRYKSFIPQTFFFLYRISGMFLWHFVYKTPWHYSFMDYFMPPSLDTIWAFSTAPYN